KKVGAIIERPNFYPYMTATQNLKLICKIKGISYDKIDEKLKTVNLYERKDSKFRTFSLGMKQRLAIASALLNDPEILILDEPTNGLDPQGIHEIRQIIKEISKKGTTILLASHLLDEVEKVCSHVVVIRKGIKLYAGGVDELTASNGLFELKVEENEKQLIELLEKHSSISSVNKEEEVLIATLNEEMSASDMNIFLFKNGITLSHLVKRKPSLEQQFLKLTSNN
ncbi:MAG: ATP-binding cassette domain-containing protein, partial [Flavobacteriaceae bacterium]|nr:ATP-binding cassette domain-containing protein [Flavobacteriaceae bacterium]